MPVMNIINMHKSASTSLNLVHVFGGDEVVVEHYYLIALEKGQEGLELSVFVESHESTYLLHLPNLIGRWGGGKEGAFDVIPEHIRKCESANEMSVPDSCADI